MTGSLRVLIIEDLPTDADLCEREIRKVAAAAEFARVETRPEFLAALEAFRPDLIISDFKLPQFDGMTALRLALANAPDTPFIVTTGSMNEDTAVECMKAGAWDYVIKEHIKRLGSAVVSALEQKEVRLRQKRAAEELRASEEKYRCLIESTDDYVYLIDRDLRFIHANGRYLERHGRTLESLAGRPYGDFHPQDRTRMFAEKIAQVVASGSSLTYEHSSQKDGKTFLRTLSPVRETAGGAVDKITVISMDITERKRAEERIKAVFGSIIRVIAGMVEKRDPYTAGHQKRVSELAWAVAREMGLETERAEMIRTAATIHDLGKIVIPAEILSKPSVLSEYEFELIKTHPAEGYDILKNVDLPEPIARIVLEHHERMDGSGYPDRKKGDQILLESRIVTVADVIEAMASHRPYRPAHGLDRALAEIERGRGTVYDPDVVAACLRLFAEKRFAWDAAPDRR
ncbi:MAG TPA: HD domain-containing phosphohydrolase [Candidatus Aminicenantes bacterium]|nr:HD domain-containing phosphohydrolase [Candidatus Aminicenantes bacterium]HRY65416.1 HD domain-containing phosphohydrolase [Candidatus Aminicenantes bacterium]HRZ72116.1 HD domain-containing phosphohydrolase [Candidatus Aminicenantes bacterium]